MKWLSYPARPITTGVADSCVVISRASTNFGAAIRELGPEKAERPLPRIRPGIHGRAKCELIVSEVKVPIRGHRELGELSDQYEIAVRAQNYCLQCQPN